ncbi:transposase family protein [Streptomyces sp. NPDC020951]|uniref:transposase family protein n=1 Tax=Streptomyces sp. NPDC020951 TaxID=3365104 RepID=UPI0037A8EAE0
MPPVSRVRALSRRARRSKGRRVIRPRDLSVDGRGLRLVWAKRRWRCDEPACRPLVHRVGPASTGT